jgi:hypothetical protein
MNAFQKLQAAIRKFVDALMPLSEAEPWRKPPPAPHFAFTTPPGLQDEESQRVAEEVKAELEKQTGKKFVMIHIGKVQCNCAECKARAAAPWN